MNPLGLVVAPIINLFNLKKRTGSLVRFWALGGFKVIKTTLLPLALLLPLSACQYLPLVDNPLPVTLNQPTPNQTSTPTTTPPTPPTCDSQLDDKSCQSQPAKPFFILENWF